MIGLSDQQLLVYLQYVFFLWDPICQGMGVIFQEKDKSIWEIRQKCTKVISKKGKWLHVIIEDNKLLE